MNVMPAVMTFLLGNYREFINDMFIPRHHCPCLTALPIMVHARGYRILSTTVDWAALVTQPLQLTDYTAITGYPAKRWRRRCPGAPTHAPSRPPTNAISTSATHSHSIHLPTRSNL